MIRIIKSKDIAKIIKLEKLFFNYNLSYDFFIKVINKTLPYIYLLDTKLFRIRAYLSVSVIENEAEVHSLATINKYQGKGIMQNLLNYLFIYLKKLKVKKVFLDCRLSNTKAIRLYEKVGFKKVAIRKNYYPSEDGITYQKEL